jgi:CheY-like chemotaxis protein
VRRSRLLCANKSLIPFPLAAAWAQTVGLKRIRAPRGSGGSSFVCMVVPLPVPRRVFVCDDSFGYPMLVKTWLEDASEIEFAGVAVTADELLSALPRSGAHVVLLDIMLPGGLVSRQLVDEVRRVASGIRVVLASAMSDEILRAETARTGADAACSKLATREELLSLILA